jgi:CheY-like chemotaxis protein
MESKGKKIRILVVEDELPIRSVLAVSLRNKGYGVVEADDAEQAIELIRENDISVILLDLLMPKTDGVDVLAYLALMPPNMKVIRIIVMTNLSVDEAKEKIGTYHVDAILTKASAELHHILDVVEEQVKLLPPDEK